MGARSRRCAPDDAPPPALARRARALRARAACGERHGFRARSAHLRLAPRGVPSVRGRALEAGRSARRSARRAAFRGARRRKPRPAHAARDARVGSARRRRTDAGPRHRRARARARRGARRRRRARTVEPRPAAHARRPPTGPETAARPRVRRRPSGRRRRSAAAAARRRDLPERAHRRRGAPGGALAPRATRRLEAADDAEATHSRTLRKPPTRGIALARARSGPRAARARRRTALERAARRRRRATPPASPQRLGSQRPRRRRLPTASRAAATRVARRRRASLTERRRADAGLVLRHSPRRSLASTAPNARGVETAIARRRAQSRRRTDGPRSTTPPKLRGAVLPPPPLPLEAAIARVLARGRPPRAKSSRHGRRQPSWIDGSRSQRRRIPRAARARDASGVGETRRTPGSALARGRRAYEIRAARRDRVRSSRTLLFPRAERGEVAGRVR